MVPEKILQKANKYQADMIADRHYLHMHPETGFDTANTLAYVKQKLTDLGYQPKLCGKSGITAVAGGKRPGKVFMLRADMDALPIQKESDVDFPSESM